MTQDRNTLHINITSRPEITQGCLYITDKLIIISEICWRIAYQLGMSVIKIGRRRQKTLRRQRVNLIERKLIHAGSMKHD